MKQVLVVGGGFAGIRTVERLSRRGRGRVEVTLVDRTNHHTFAPLLYQVATAGLSPQDVARGLRPMNARSPDVRVRRGEVTSVDLQQRQVRLNDGRTLAYDHLVLAPGAVTADFGVPGVSDYALPLKTVGDAVTIRNHILERFEAAAEDPDPAHDLTIVVAGGGPTGVELAGALAELRDTLLKRDFVELASRCVRVVLVERFDGVLPGFSETSRAYTRRALEHAGVELVLGAGIARVHPDHVEFDDGTTIESRTVIWAAGVRANPLVAGLGLPTDRSGRLEVESDLSLPGHPEVSLIGDAALIRDAAGRPVPQVAPAAMQQGRHVADQILRRLDEQPTRSFRYRDKGAMATIGRNAAVNEYPFGLRLRGFLAWAAWLMLHLVYLAGFRNRLSALLTWAWGYVTYDRSLRVVFEPTAPRPDVSADVETPVPSWS